MEINESGKASGSEHGPHRAGRSAARRHPRAEASVAEPDTAVAGTLPRLATTDPGIKERWAIPNRDEIIVVDELNRAVGRAEKQAVHTTGLLHRAFSIFLVDRGGQLLLQRRSRSKYHSGGLWANSCCGHPRPGERTYTSARRRLGEELGASASLQFGFRARYHTALANGLVENEIVYVYFGTTPDGLVPNQAEVMAIARMSLSGLNADIARHPRRYAYWLRYYMRNHYAAIQRGVAAALRRWRRLPGPGNRT